MINIVIKDSIILKHAKYIKDSAAGKEIDKLREKKFCEFLAEKYDDTFIDEHIRFCQYLLNEIRMIDENISDNLFLGNVGVLEKKIIEIEQKFPLVCRAIGYAEKISGNIKYREEIVAALGYEKFVSHGICFKENTEDDVITIGSYDYDKHGWGAYGYVMALGLKVCPYCNKNHIAPIYSKNGKLRADLDHFFPKHKYPYLSMSLFNLVPSCRFCNSSLKGKREFTIDKNFHPFSEIEADDLYRFTYVPRSVKGFWDKDNMDVDIIYDRRNPDSEKIKNNNEIFCIKEIYQYYKEIVERMIKKKYIYNETYIEYLLNKYPVFWSNSKDIFDFLIMEDISERSEDIPFAKLKKDIAEELGF